MTRGYTVDEISEDLYKLLVHCMTHLSNDARNAVTEVCIYLMNKVQLSIWVDYTIVLQRMNVQCCNQAHVIMGRPKSMEKYKSIHYSKGDMIEIVETYIKSYNSNIDRMSLFIGVLRSTL